MQLDEHCKMITVSRHNFLHSHKDEEIVFRPIKVTGNTTMLHTIMISSSYSVYFLHVKSFIATCSHFPWFASTLFWNSEILPFYLTLHFMSHSDEIEFCVVVISKVKLTHSYLLLWDRVENACQTEVKTEKTLSKTVYQGWPSTFPTW